MDSRSTSSTDADPGQAGPSTSPVSEVIPDAPSSDPHLPTVTSALSYDTTPPWYGQQTRAIEHQTPNLYEALYPGGPGPRAVQSPVALHYGSSNPSHSGPSSISDLAPPPQPIPLQHHLDSRSPSETPPLGQPLLRSFSEPLSQFSQYPTIPSKAVEAELTEAKWDNNGKGGRVRVQCQRCHAWVGTSTFKYTLQSMVAPMTTHVNGNNCRSRISRSLGSGHSAPTNPTMSTSSSSLPPQSPHLVPLPQPPHTPTHSHTIGFDLTTPSFFRSHHFSFDSASDDDMEGCSPPPSPSQANQRHCQSCLKLTQLLKGHAVLRHEDASLGYSLSWEEVNGGMFYVKADTCTMSLRADGSACKSCQELTSKVHRLAALAKHADPHTNYKFLTHAQLCDLLHAKGTQLNDLKLKLVSQCLKEGASIPAILAKLEQSITGVYHARGYNADDRTSPSLLFVLVVENSFGPVFLADPFHIRTGMSMMWDEISQGGLVLLFALRFRWRSMSGTLSLGRHQLEFIRKRGCYCTCSRRGDVHYGKESSVIAMGSFDDELRGAYPIFVSPTCKKETPTQSGEILQMGISAWNDLHDLSSAYLDVFLRTAMLDVARWFTISYEAHHCPTHALFKTFRWLTVNIGMVDLSDTRRDANWKQSSHGDLHASASTCSRCEDVRVLMNPSDSQDVPRAIDFIDAVADVSALAEDPATVNRDPSQQQEAAIQVARLSKYAHLAFAFFREHRVNFMPYSLYGDTQTTVKNAIFCIAKQKELDPDMVFLLFKLGDDRLEELFGLVREQGGHNPNFSFKELLERLGAGVDIAGVLSRKRDLDPGHRRLKVSRTEHADHLNSESWRGDAVVKYVNLERAWIEGRRRCCQVLARLNFSIDFTALFADGTVDMLKPFGDGKYPGVSTEYVDRSLEPDELPSAASVPEPSPIHSSIIPDLPHDPLQPIVTSLDDAELDQLATAPYDNLKDSGSRTSEAELDIDLDNGDEDLAALEAGESGGVDDLAEALANQDGPLDLPSEHSKTSSNSNILPPAAPSPWIIYKGRKIHKATICRLVITPNWVRKSNDRLLRVRGYSSGLKQVALKLNSSNILDEGTFMVGDLFASFIACSIVLEERSSRVEHVQLNKLPHTGSGIRITGQILALQQLPANDVTYVKDSDESDSISESLSNTSAPNLVQDQVWVWSGEFVKLALANSARVSTGKAARKTIAVKVASYICMPLNPRIAVVSDALRSRLSGLQGSRISWVMASDELDAVMTQLWDNVKSRNAITIIPKFGSNVQFPYSNVEGTPSLISVPGSIELERESEANHEPSKFRCFQCLATMERSKARDHVAGHILKSLRGVKEELPSGGQPVGDSMPCGICGRSGIAACSEVFLTKGKSPQAVSRCQYFHKYHYKPSLESTATGPSTNTPIQCQIPNCTAVTPDRMITAHWKFNMPEHIRRQHPGYSLDGVTGAPVTAAFARSMHITAIEEERLGIPAEKIPPPCVLLVESSLPHSPDASKRLPQAAKRSAAGALAKVVASEFKRRKSSTT
ncbi:hypothetical protein BXZ70DRAFT_1036584 [Cristinia sonorae]|uniref:Uncharacterized protein n=1 Tax=Cristinia sonorae TaxID=1940300 RepID=A0A8K0UX52_9AGAR|nr:hypothetical protein BXZ70DRAFT_1036584 [Cristinia sonorae]